jgi:hypothetical protein
VQQFAAFSELATAVENVAALNRQTSEAQAALAAVKKQQEEAALELEILHAAKRDLPTFRSSSRTKSRGKADTASESPRPRPPRSPRWGNRLPHIEEKGEMSEKLTWLEAISQCEKQEQDERTARSRRIATLPKRRWPNCSSSSE